MEIYERPGWAHPSPLINPTEEVLEEEVLEEEVLEENATIEEITE
jgi:hypothetical protein